MQKKMETSNMKQHSTNVRFCKDKFERKISKGVGLPDNARSDRERFVQWRDANAVNFEYMQNTTQIFVKPHFDLDKSMENPTENDAAELLVEFVAFCNERGFDMRPRENLNVLVEYKPSKLSIHVVVDLTRSRAYGPFSE